MDIKKQKSNAPLLCVLIMKNQIKLNHISIPTVSTTVDLGNIISIRVRTLILALVSHVLMLHNKNVPTTQLSLAHTSPYQLYQSQCGTPYSTQKHSRLYKEQSSLRNQHTQQHSSRKHLAI